MKKIFLLLAVSFASVSCLVDDEDRQHANANSPYIVGFNKASSVQSYIATGDVVDLNVPVILIGGADGLPNASDITITYGLGPATTAVEGDDFDFASTDHTVVIPAGQTTISIPLKINTGNIPTGDVNVKIDLEITSVTPGIVIGQQFDSTLITINGLCFSNLAKTYNLLTTRMDTGVVYNLPNEVVTSTGDGTYLTSSTGPYNNRGAVSAGAQVPSTTPGFNFTDVCDALSLETQNLCNLYSNLVQQSAAQAAGSFTAPNDVMTIQYTITFAAGNRNYTGVYTPIP